MLCRHLSTKLLFYIVILEGDCIDHAFTVRWLRTHQHQDPGIFRGHLLRNSGNIYYRGDYFQILSSERTKGIDPFPDDF